MANAPAMNIKIDVDARDVQRRIEAGAMGLDSYINSALVASADFVKGEIKSHAPQGVGARMGAGLKNSVVAVSLASTRSRSTLRCSAPPGWTAGAKRNARLPGATGAGRMH